MSKTTHTLLGYEESTHPILIVRETTTGFLRKSKVENKRYVCFRMLPLGMGCWANQKTGEEVLGDFSYQLDTWLALERGKQ